MKDKQDHPEHPYIAFEDTPLWRAVDRAISDLEKNQDLKLTALREYVGYICKQLKRRKLVQESAIAVNDRRRTRPRA
jgi:hypothetical protein